MTGRSMHRPVAGGLLSRPADRWPETFQGEFWTQHPYFLPCIIAAVYSISAFVFAFVGLKEVRRCRESAMIQKLKNSVVQTLTPAMRKSKRVPAGGYTKVDTAEEPLLDSAENAEPDDEGITRPERRFGGSDEALDTKLSKSKSVIVEEFEVLGSPDTENGEEDGEGEFHSGRAYTTLRSILIPQVLYPILNYAFLAFVDQSIVVLMPLMYSTPVSAGGLGFDPFTIGAVQGASGIIGGAVQIYTFPYLHARLGAKMLYVYGFAAFLPTLCAFAVMQHVTRLGGGVTGLTWLTIVLQQTAYAGTFMTYGACPFNLPDL